MREQSKADEVRQMNEREDEPLLNLILSGEQKIEASFNFDKMVHCPICQGDELFITETSEGDSERVYFQIKCQTCGCEFVLVEDLAESCQRGIENAKAEIEYNKNKIEYFNKKLKGE